MVSHTKDDIALLLERLARSDAFHTRYEAVKALSLLACRRSAEALGAVAADSGEDADLRIEAIMGLAKVAAPEQVKTLIDALSDPSGEIRLSSVRALREAGDQSAAPRLAEVMAGSGDDMSSGNERGWNPQWDIQMEAIRALGEIGTEEIAEPVIRLYENEMSYDLLGPVADALIKIGSDEAVKFLAAKLTAGTPRERREITVRLASAAKVSEKLEKELALTLVDPDSDVRVAGARALVKIDGEKAVPALVMMLRDENWEVRSVAVELLAGTGMNGLVVRLQPMLGDPHPKVRQSLVRALAKLSGESAVETLLKIMDNDRDEEVTLAALSCLAAVAAPGIVERLGQLIGDREKIPYSRIQCVNILEERYPDRIADALIPFIRTQPRQVSVAIVTALARSKDRDAHRRLAGVLLDLTGNGSAVEDPIGNRDAGSAAPRVTDLIEQGAGTFDEAGQPDGGETMVVVGKKSKSAVKFPGATPGSCRAADIANALGESSHCPEVIEALIMCLKSGDHAAAARSLGGLRAVEAAPALLEALGHASESVRAMAAMALGRIGDVTMAAKLGETLLNDKNPAPRVNAARALSMLGAPESLDPLTKGINDGDSDVRRECVSAMGYIASPEAVSLLIPLLFDYDRYSEIRGEVCSALKRLDRNSVTDELLATLNSNDRAGDHWIAIQALGKIYS